MINILNKDFKLLTDFEKKELIRYIKANYGRFVVTASFSLENEIVKYNYNTKKLLAHLDKLNKENKPFYIKAYLMATFYITIFCFLILFTIYTFLKFYI